MDRFGTAAAMKSINNLLLLGDGETWNRQRIDFAGLPEMVRTFLQVAAGAADIPVTRLLGQSPAGLSATGESDTRNYYDMIAARQELELRPALERLDRVIAASEGIDPGALDFAFRPLWQLDAASAATIALQKAQATQVYAGLKLWPAATTTRLVEAQLAEDGTYPNAQAVFGEGGAVGSTAASPTLDFDPDQPRDGHGRWTAGGAAPGTPEVSTTGANASAPMDPVHGSSPDLLESLNNLLGPLGTGPESPTSTEREHVVAAQFAPAVPILRALIAAAAFYTYRAVESAVQEIAKHLPSWSRSAPPQPGPQGSGPPPSEPPDDPRPLTIHPAEGSSGPPGSSPASPAPSSPPGLSPAPPSPGLPPSVAYPPSGQTGVPAGQAPASGQSQTPGGPYSLNEQAEDPEEKARQEQIREDLEEKFDNLKKHIKDDDTFAAWEESRGNHLWTKDDGTPYNHQDEVSNAQRGLKDVIGRVKGLLGRPRLLPSEVGPLQDLLGRASRALDRTEGYVPSDKQKTGDALTWLNLSSSNASDDETHKMNGRTLGEYLRRALRFELSEREVDDVAEYLRTTDDDKARLHCIMILRRQGSRAHVPLIAPLIQSADQGVADEAMRFMIRDADRADLCRDLLLEWLGDESEFGFKQLDAVQLAGEAYLQLGDKALLREIVRLLDHERRDSMGASAADSLVKALTPDYKRMMPRDSHLLLRQADIADYRRRAEAILRAEPSAH